MPAPLSTPHSRVVGVPGISLNGNLLLMMQKSTPAGGLPSASTHSTASRGGAPFYDLGETGGSLSDISAVTSASLIW